MSSPAFGLLARSIITLSIIAPLQLGNVGAVKADDMLQQQRALLSGKTTLVFVASTGIRSATERAIPDGQDLARRVILGSRIAENASLSYSSIGSHACRDSQELAREVLLAGRSSEFPARDVVGFCGHC